MPDSIGVLCHSPVAGENRKILCLLTPQEPEGIASFVSFTTPPLG